MINTSKLTIVFVHGLASKPPGSDLHRLWKKTFIENIRLDSISLTNELEANPDILSQAIGRMRFRIILKTP